MIAQGNGLLQMAKAYHLLICRACFARKRALYLTALLFNISDTFKLGSGGASVTA